MLLDDTSRADDIIVSVVSDQNTTVLRMYMFTGGRLMAGRQMRRRLGVLL